MVYLKGNRRKGKTYYSLAQSVRSGDGVRTVTLAYVGLLPDEQMVRRLREACSQGRMEEIHAVLESKAREEAVTSLQEAVDIARRRSIQLTLPKAPLIIAMAVPEARTIGDVASITIRPEPRKQEAPAFGHDNRGARLLLQAMERRPDLRAVLEMPLPFPAENLPALYPRLVEVIPLPGEPLPLPLEGKLQGFVPKGSERLYLVGAVPRVLVTKAAMLHSRAEELEALTPARTTGRRGARRS